MFLYISIADCQIIDENCHVEQLYIREERKDTLSQQASRYSLYQLLYTMLQRLIHIKIQGYGTLIPMKKKAC